MLTRIAYREQDFLQNVKIFATMAGEYVLKLLKK